MKFISPILYTIIIVTKIKKGFLKQKERVKGFFIFYFYSFFIYILWLKQVESNYTKKQPCKRGCSWIIKFSHC